AEGATGLRLGIDWEFAGEGMAPAIVASLESALGAFEKLGLRVADVRFPWRDEQSQEMQALFGAEIALAHADHFPAQADRYGPWLRGTLEHARGGDALAIARGHIARDRYRGRLRRLFGEVDLVLVPALGRIRPRCDQV